jgi:voltage-gated potassium channel
MIWNQLIAALILCVSNICIHALGTYANLLWILRALKQRPLLTLTQALWIMLRLVLMLLLLHALEVAVWAQFYVWWRCLPDWETAFYYSLVTYTTLGQGDVLLPHAWRITGGCEAMIGVLLFGWSVANLVTFTRYVQDAKVRKYFSAVAE